MVIEEGEKRLKKNRTGTS